MVKISPKAHNQGHDVMTGVGYRDPGRRAEVWNSGPRNHPGRPAAFLDSLGVRYKSSDKGYELSTLFMYMIEVIYRSHISKIMSLPQKQLCAWVETPGPEAKIEFRDIEVPRPATGQVLVKLEVSGVW